MEILKILVSIEGSAWALCLFVLLCEMTLSVLEQSKCLIQYSDPKPVLRLHLVKKS